MKTQQIISCLFCLVIITCFSSSCGLVIKEHYSTLEYKFVNKTNKQISFTKSQDLLKPNSTGTIYFRGFNRDEMNDDYFKKKTTINWSL